MTAPFDPFSQPWRGPRRDELIRRYLAHDSSAGEALVLLTFLAPPDEQWTFILELIAAAQDDDDILSHIAAGPIEGLLGRHGPAVIVCSLKHGSPQWGSVRTAVRCRSARTCIGRSPPNVVNATSRYRPRT